MTTDSSFCDYSKITLYKAGEFNSKYKTDILSVSTELKINSEDDFVKKRKVQNTFLDGKYTYWELNESVILYRVFGVYKEAAKSYRNGSFFSTEFAESKIDVKLRLALLTEWNTRMFEEKVRVPKGTKFYYGIAAPQESKTSTYPGGAEQIVIDAKDRSNIDDWIEGYRYITSRQLTTIPDYPLHSVDEIVQDKAKVHPIVCPKCSKCDISKKVVSGYQYKCNECGYVW